MHSFACMCYSCWIETSLCAFRFALDKSNAPATHFFEPNNTTFLNDFHSKSTKNMCLSFKFHTFFSIEKNSKINFNWKKCGKWQKSKYVCIWCGVDVYNAFDQIRRIHARTSTQSNVERVILGKMNECQTEKTCDTTTRSYSSY